MSSGFYGTEVIDFVCHFEHLQYHHRKGLFSRHSKTLFVFRSDVKKAKRGDFIRCVCEWYSETLTNVRILYKTADFANCIN